MTPCENLSLRRGPVGELVRQRLHETAQDVSLVARGQRLQDITRHGVVIKEEGSTREASARIRVVESMAADDDYDLVMIVMRKNQADAILDTLARNQQVPTFLFLSNNGAGPDQLVSALGRERGMLGFPLPGGRREGHVMRPPRQRERTYTLPIGEVEGTITPRARKVKAVLESMRGYRVQLRRDMPRWLKYHVALLMPGFVPAMYAASNRMKRLGNTRDLMVLAVRAIKEALRGLRQAGVPPSPAGVRS